MKREVMIINCSLVRPYFHRIEKQRQKHGENWFIFRFSNRSHFTAAPWPFSNSFFFSFRVKCCRLKREVHIHDDSSSFYYLRLIRILICLFSALLIIFMHVWGRGKKESLDTCDKSFANDNKDFIFDQKAKKRITIGAFALTQSHRTGWKSMRWL